MPWQTPKTSWAAADEFRLAPDYERIKNNLLYLQTWAAQLTQASLLQPMADYQISGLPYAEFFNRVEQNLATLATVIYPRPDYETRSFLLGGRVWDWRDLDRIESMALQLYQDLAALAAAQRKCKFKLGGGLIGSFI